MMAVIACMSFVLFILLFGPVLRNQTVEICDRFFIVRTFGRAVQLNPEHLTEVVKCRDDYLCYKFHAGGILYYQVTPRGYYHAGALQTHFDRLFDLDKLGVRVREPGRRR